MNRFSIMYSKSISTILIVPWIAIAIVVSSWNSYQYVQSFQLFHTQPYRNGNNILGRSSSATKNNHGIKYIPNSNKSFFVRSSRNDENDHDNNNMIPSTTPKKMDKESLTRAQQDWLKSRSSDESNNNSVNNDQDLLANVNIPKTGMSVDDEITAMKSKEKFISTLYPMKSSCVGVARIETILSDTLGIEPIRYLVPIDPLVPKNTTIDTTTNNNGDDDHDDVKTRQPTRYVLVDIPPYSTELISQIQTFLSSHHGTLTAILVTSSDSIHYDEAPAVYTSRKSALDKWKESFPNIEIVMYRLDTPRDCKESVTIMLDGYGPWALKDDDDDDDSDGKRKFDLVETGRPLTILEWDSETQTKVLDQGLTPPDDDNDDTNSNKNDNDDSDLYTPQAIRLKEKNKKLLAIYTPGHTFGSMTYIFPHTKLCCSGYTLPIEDTRPEANRAGIANAGPMLDYRGYLSTNKGGIERQIESANVIIEHYNDRVDTILPARGPALYLGDQSLDDKARMLKGILYDFAELGRVYEQLGVI